MSPVCCGCEIYFQLSRRMYVQSVCQLKFKSKQSDNLVNWFGLKGEKGSSGDKGMKGEKGEPGPKGRKSREVK